LSEQPAGRSGAAILIAAASGRALAAAARRAGYRPLVADFFDDADTGEICVATRRAGYPDSGFDATTLIPALDALAKGRAPAGLVYGAGFEDRPGLLDEIARRWPLFGNPPDVVRRAKDPALLSRLCAARGVPHSEISLAPPPEPAGWLVKSVGGAGGGHVAPAGAARARGENLYFQRVAPGDPVSLLCLCAGAHTRTLGASRQWAAPAPDEPFRFGGCVRPAGLVQSMEAQLRRAAAALAAALDLTGLNSFDFLVAGDAFTLIEVNPRPGATLDIFEDRDGALFQAHLDACRGVPPARALEFSGAAAAGVAYARRAIAALPPLDWPAWTADRSRPETPLRLYDPLCTIKASAADPSRARALVAARTSCLLDRLDHLNKGATA
jgi:predicted ATP-grasp superfamily ATP-dependent carboligase